jgi:hypothetical protein
VEPHAWHMCVQQWMTAVDRSGHRQIHSSVILAIWGSVASAPAPRSSRPLAMLQEQMKALV